ncbi:MAG: protein kinase [Acidobacteriota bacterium]
MSDRKDRLAKMMGASSAQPAPAGNRADKATPPPALRKRALLFAPPPARSSAYLSLLEAEGFDALLAPDTSAAEALIRTTPPELILGVVPTLGPEVLRTWRELAPQAEIRLIPGLVPLLEEHLVPPKEALEFTIRALWVAAGIVSVPRGVPRGRTAQILHLAEKSARTLGFGSRDFLRVRLAAVLGELAEALRSSELSSDQEGPVANPAPADPLKMLADFAEAVGSPFPLGELPEGPPKSRTPVPEEVVEAAKRLVLFHEEKSPNPSLALRRLALAEEEGGSELHPAAVEAVLAASKEGPGPAGAEILLVDSDASARNLLALRLSNEGYRVRTAGDGRKALEEIRREAPALVISDAVLPGLDGYALLDTLKRDGKGGIPLMFLSSRVDPLSINKGLLLGAADFLAKPVNFEVLLTKLQKVLAEKVDLSEVSARLSLSDVTQVSSDYPTVTYEDLAEGVVILGRFRVEVALGEGGMGKVFKAWDQRLEEQVVIKVMKPGFSDDVLRRFKREIRLARKITHPGVVRIFDFWEAGPLKFVTMEFLEGTNLRMEFKRRGSFPVPVALRVASEIFEALASAHEVGIVHRDIKPHNVLMLPTGKVKVLDFGIAQGLEADTPDGATTTSSILGTPEYMSPEQLMGQPLDARTDLYSAGILLYELLAGQLPFQAEDRLAAARMRLGTEPAPPSSKNPKVPPEVDGLVVRLLKRNRDERYATAKAAMEELKKIRR